jgi:hypothetical protein
LIVGDLMPRFINAREGEVSVLPDFAVFNVVYHEWGVRSSAEFGTVRIVDLH